jgi:hypothetical protein
MKLEADKKYVCRDMPDIKYIKVLHIEPSLTRYPVWTAAYYVSGDIVTEEFTLDGRYCYDPSGEIEHNMDLVDIYEGEE